jgi:hypothetical protein
LKEELSTKSAHAGDTFTAEVTQPVRADNDSIAIPAGTVINGEVIEVESGKTLPMIRGKGRLSVRFRDMTLPSHTSVPLTATLLSVHGKNANAEGEVESSTSGKDAAKNVGIGAGLGTVAGLIFGSALKGLAIGAIAGGGYVLATSGKDVDIPADSTIKLRLDQPLSIPAAASNSGVSRKYGGQVTVRPRVTRQGGIGPSCRVAACWRESLFLDRLFNPRQVIGGTVIDLNGNAFGKLVRVQFAQR